MPLIYYILLTFLSFLLALKIKRMLHDDTKTSRNVIACNPESISYISITLYLISICFIIAFTVIAIYLDASIGCVIAFYFILKIGYSCLLTQEHIKQYGIYFDEHRKESPKWLETLDLFCLVILILIFI